MRRLSVKFGTWPNVWQSFMLIRITFAARLPLRCLTDNFYAHNAKAT